MLCPDELRSQPIALIIKLSALGRGFAHIVWYLLYKFFKANEK